MILPTPHLHLGRYGLYVWPAYAASALVIGGLMTQTLVRARRWRRAAERRRGATDKPDRG